MTTASPSRPPRREVPRQEDDYTAAAARQRRTFVAEATGASPEHIGRLAGKEVGQRTQQLGTALLLKGTGCLRSTAEATAELTNQRN
jgi:hypothetical protein